MAKSTGHKSNSDKEVKERRKQTTLLGDIRQELGSSRVLSSAILLLTILVFAFTGILVMAALSYNTHPILTSAGVIIIMLLIFYLVNKTNVYHILTLAGQIMIGSATRSARRNISESVTETANQKLIRLTLVLVILTLLLVIVNIFSPFISNYLQTGHFLLYPFVSITCMAQSSATYHNQTVYWTFIEIQNKGTAPTKLFDMQIVTNGDVYPNLTVISGSANLQPIEYDHGGDFVEISNIAGTEMYQGSYEQIQLLTTKPGFLIQEIHLDSGNYSINAQMVNGIVAYGTPINYSYKNSMPEINCQ